MWSSGKRCMHNCRTSDSRNRGFHYPERRNDSDRERRPRNSWPSGNCATQASTLQVPQQGSRISSQTPRFRLPLDDVFIVILLMLIVFQFLGRSPTHQDLHEQCVHRCEYEESSAPGGSGPERNSQGRTRRLLCPQRQSRRRQLRSRPR